MVRAMHLRVAIHAVTECERRDQWTRPARQSGRAVGEARVPLLRVARLAEQRSPRGEHAAARRPVRRVAVRAVLGDRRVLPEERTALVGVALVAGLVDRGLDEL